MKYIVSFILCALFSSALNAQKRPISHLDYDKWEMITQQSVTNDGRYVAYTISSQDEHSTFVSIEATKEKWKLTVKSACNIAFTDDSHYAIFRVGRDTIGYIKLGGDRLRQIPGIVSYKTAKKASIWIAYQKASLKVQKRRNSVVYLYNVASGLERMISPASDYQFSDDGRVLLVNAVDEFGRLSLLWVNVTDGSVDTISRGSNSNRLFAFDNLSQRVAFISEDRKNKGKDRVLSLRIYKEGMDSAEIFVQSKEFDAGDEWGVADEIRPVFSRNGSCVFFGMRPKEDAGSYVSRSDMPRVTIWSYQDAYLKSRLISDIESGYIKNYFLAVVNEHKEVVRLARKDETDAAWDKVELPELGDSKLALAVSSSKYRNEAGWLEYPRRDAWLIDTRNGERTLLKSGLRGPGFFLSPYAKFVVWYDPQDRQYYSFDVKLGVSKVITFGIRQPLYLDDYDMNDYPPAFGFAGWDEEGNFVYIYDKYDIWRVDLKGNKLPFNVTKGVGRERRTVLRYYKHAFDRGFINGRELFRGDDLLILKAFNLDTKYSGIYTKLLRNTDDPLLRDMGPWSFSFIEKAKDAGLFLIGKMSSESPENLYVTTDFRNLKQMSNLNVHQEQINWLTCELLKWEGPDGLPAEGLLYKPEDFDPNRKYPVIFHFYEKDANNLYKYLEPWPSNGTINIPYFVSNGYIVCDPNIYYKMGKPGESALRSIISAVNYLAQFPWVDTSKMGIQGHSFGGYQVNYIVSHSNRFAAAASTAGISNFLSEYGTNMSRRDVSNTYWWFEVRGGRLGKSLWENTNMYIYNSPIVRANMVNTPLLIVHNDKDEVVPFSQGIEFFSALRRLKKKTWMLQYNGEDHSISSRENQVDFSIRLGQFFDHFLKGKPLPRWMSESAPFDKRYDDAGLDYVNHRDEK